MLDEEKVKKRTLEITQKNITLEQQKEEILTANEELNVQKEEILTANEELNVQKEELQSTLENLKQAQSQLVQSEKMASVGQLTAGIAHEINNPVTFISAGVDSLITNLEEIGQVFLISSLIVFKNDN